MRCERYIKEYATARIKAIKDNELIQPGIKVVKVTAIEKAVAWRQRGSITIDETVKLILEA